MLSLGYLDTLPIQSKNYLICNNALLSFKFMKSYRLISVGLPFLYLGWFLLDRPKDLGASYYLNQIKNKIPSRKSF